LDQSYTELVDLLLSCDVMLFTVVEEIAIVDNTGVVSLPTDHYKTLAVEYKQAPNLFMELDPISFARRNEYQYSVGWASGFREVGAQLLLPGANVGQVYRHTYIPAPDILIPTAPAWAPATSYVAGNFVLNFDMRFRCTTSGVSAALPALGPDSTADVIVDGTVAWSYFSPDDVTLDGIAGWEELLVVKAAIRCLIKEGTDYGELSRLEAMLIERIKQAAADRMPPQKMRNVRDLRSRGRYPYRWY
jgi:hypothetical protein